MQFELLLKQQYFTAIFQNVNISLLFYPTYVIKYVNNSLHNWWG